MLINRRRFLAIASAAGLIRPSRARLLRGLTVTAPTRVLIAVYGQSNADGFAQSQQSPSAPFPVANTNCLFYNTAVSSSPYHPPVTPNAGAIGDGLIVCMNQINNVTGLPVVALNGAVGGNPISLLVPGTSIWTAFINQVNAVIQPTDFVIMLWDQGEGDATQSPREVPQDYVDPIGQIQQGFASATGRPNVPMLISALGTVSNQTGQSPNGGITDATWHTIQAAQFNCGIQLPNVYFSQTNIDLVRGDGFHYGAPYIQNMGWRFAHSVLTLMGYTSGFPHFQITSAATANATQTTVNVASTLGTDFVPTASEDGWQVSGDNGASWVSGTGARQNSGQLLLTHSSLTTTNARLVRYQYGMNQNGNVLTPTPGLLADNSVLSAGAAGVALTPTTWDVRPTALSTVPCLTWRNIDTLSVVSAGPPRTFTSRKLLCWPTTDNYQKFILIAVYSGFPIDTVHNPLTLKVQPDVGSQVTASFVCQYPSAANIGMAIYQAQLGTDADAAQYLTITGSEASNSFNSYGCVIFDVPFLNLNSTTSTGNNSSTSNYASGTTVPVSNSCTCTVSAGGFILAMNLSDQICNVTGGFATYSSTFANRWEDTNHVTLDAANCSANASFPFTISMSPQNTNAMNIYTLMASWR